ncbi:hypothetical protein BAE44_0010566 [Dichanthelium oligosanthes]|uniref:Uncharacterized protein n=1 Tax=Dichanthelium oligosanthes TaxID=888268 RepID=A0A1E5VTH3_9POAL|nr:hypothetical protein BAE44_0010566 [Dichanthelium oligosanthes]
MPSSPASHGRRPSPAVPRPLVSARVPLRVMWIRDQILPRERVLAIQEALAGFNFEETMQGEAVKLRKALMALLDTVEEACAGIRAVVIANLVSEMEEVDWTLLHIDNLVSDLANLAVEFQESMDPNSSQNWYMAPNWTSFFLADQISEAIRRFNALEKRPFAISHCWAVLKDEAKWLHLQGNRTAAQQDLDGP